MKRQERLLHGAVGGEDVRLLQLALRERAYDPGVVDAVYGPKTAAAVRRYQADRGLSVDGVVGEQTWEQLSREGSRLRSRRLERTIVGATGGDDVTEVQLALREAGFDPGPIDGVYGPATEAAVVSFQRIHGVDADGIVGPETKSALLSARLRISGTVAGALRLRGNIGPTEVVNEVLRHHSEYGGKRAASMHLAAREGEPQEPAVEWIARVRALFDHGAAPALHGRLVVIGLALLDSSVAAGLRRNNFLEMLIGELDKPLEQLLTVDGRARRAVLGLQDITREDRFQSLSPGAVRALVYADGVREGRQQQAVHTEHLLAGLYAEEDGPARRLLAERIAEEELSALLGEPAEIPTQAPVAQTQDPVVVRIPTSMPELSAHVAQAVDNAFRLAGELGSTAVDTVHLFHGLLSVEGCDLVERLAGRGIRANDIEALWETPVPKPATPARAPVMAGAAADTVPEPGNGRVRGADRLGTTQEVEMLVSVLLAKDTPLPLAVGLFGDWGSGKSFFMAHMHERIDELAQLATEEKPEAEPFCRHVRQVRFNAWHYVDTNLWASLAATLFDELARAGRLDETQKKLDNLDRARKTATDARAAREKLEREAKNLEAKVEAPAAVARASATVAIRGVRNDRKLREKLRRATSQDSAGDEHADRLVAALGDLRGTAEKAGTVWRLFQEEVLYRRRWTTILTLLTLIVVAVATAAVTGLPAVTKAGTFVGAVLGAAVPAFNGALRVLFLAREVRERRELPLLEKRDELARARAEEEVAEGDVAQRERELAELRDKGLRLQQFVRERAASSDYRQELGVISKVRRDFEQLVALTPGALGETGAKQVAAVAAAVTERVPEVERIFLYIDDLDRCPHQKVVEVLQAVHLLLAFKLFVVIVGVDSGWLKRSLQAQYGNLLEEPENYLEKIFQIPFTLRRMTLPVYQDLIERLVVPTGGSPKEVGKQPGDAEEEPSKEPGGQTTMPDRSGEVAEKAVEDTNMAMGNVVPGPQAPHPTLTGEAPPEPKPRPEALVISDDERTMLGYMGGIVPTPRAAKRLVNIYRMLRVSVPEDELDAFDPHGGGEYQAAVVLLGVLVGRPTLAEDVLRAVVETSDDDDIWRVLENFPDVYKELAPARSHVTVKQAKPYRRWAPRVSRFSFRLAAVITEPPNPT